MGERTVVERSIVNCDVSRSTRIQIGSTEIQTLIQRSCNQVGLEPIAMENYSQTGDGAVIVFPSAVQALLFAETLHDISFYEHNATARSEEKCCSFRIGIASGEITKPERHFWTGRSFEVAERLQRKCVTGGVVVDEETYKELPKSAQSRFGPYENIPGKEHETNPDKTASGYAGLRRTFVPPAPWEAEWKDTGPEKAKARKELEWEFYVALGAIYRVRPMLDNLFDRGRVTAPNAKDMVKTDIVDRNVSVFATNVYDALVASLHRSQYSFIDRSIFDDKSENQERYWVVNALEGSRQVKRDRPFFTSTLALIEQRNVNKDTTRPRFEVLIGITYIPFTQELFFAIKEGGAFLNDWNRLIEVNPEKRLKQGHAYVELPIPYGRKPDEHLDEDIEMLKQLIQNSGRLRGIALGSFAMAYVAKGAYECYVGLSRSTKIHHMAAGILFIQEAGGTVLQLDEQVDADDSIRCIAGNKQIVDQLKKKLRVVDRVKVFPLRSTP